SLVWNESTYDRFQYDDLGGAVDASGRRLAGAPRIAFVLAYQHTFHLGSLVALTPALRCRYQSGVWMYYLHVPGMWQERFTTTDLTLTFALDTNPKLSITAYVRNIEDNATLLTAFDARSTGSAFATLSPPRTFGLVATGSL